MDTSVLYVRDYDGDLIDRVDIVVAHIRDLHPNRRISREDVARRLLYEAARSPEIIRVIEGRYAY